MPSRSVDDRDRIGIFAKAPIPGGVKTRLAAQIGPAAAAALYRQIGRKVIATAAAWAAGRTVVWYTPVGRRAAVGKWLHGIPGVALQAQPAGDLGQRLHHAFARHFAGGARRVVLIGSDCPDITEEILARAFAGLEAADLVLGPAADGGYYLIGLRRPLPQLFRHIPWSTDQVFHTTLERGRALGCSSRVLPRLRDVDTLADARALGLL